MLGFSNARFGNEPLDGDPAASSRQACRTRRGVVMLPTLIEVPGALKNTRQLREDSEKYEGW
jgi:hypothetical protein